MHIPWGWIKQRPHFLAEELSKIYQLDIYTPKVYKKNNLIKNNTMDKINIIFKLPFERFVIIKKINIYLVRYLLKFKYKFFNYKYIWITDLRLYPQIKTILKNEQKLIYDCMDDVLEFEILKYQKNELKKIEEELYNRADKIFFSSKNLYELKSKAYNLDKNKIEIVYNALDNKFLSKENFDEYNYIFNKYKDFKIVTYIGTISSWIDFEAIQKSLDNIENIVYFLVGPVERNTDILKNKRVVYIGSVEHRFVKVFIEKSDILVMPFKLNALIESVDPVKLYEYIAIGKNVIATKYNEVIKFEKYVSFYSSIDEYLSVLNLNLQNIKETRINQDFIKNNNWKQRIEIIRRYLDGEELEKKEQQ